MDTYGEKCPECSRTTGYRHGERCSICLSGSQSIDTSDLDPIILDRQGLSAALNDRKDRLGR